jgi:signal transduction histidine kinase
MAQDAERRRIARELHDTTAQNLLGATLNIARVTRGMPNLGHGIREPLDAAQLLIDQTQRELRTLSYLLHPPMLDEAGLPSALQLYIDGFAQRSGIAVKLEISPELLERRMRSEVEMALFRVVQEGLTNVHRHSGSSIALVDLRLSRTSPEQRQLVLEIADSGSGMRREPSASSVEDERPGIGLSSMRERVGQLGGFLRVTSDPCGTKIRVFVPLENDAMPLVGASRE